MTSLKGIDLAMLISSGRLHAALCGVATRLGQMGDALSALADEWNQMYRNGSLLKFPEGEFGKDYDEFDEELAQETLRESLKELIKEDFGFDWGVTQRGRMGSTFLPSEGPKSHKPIFSRPGGYRDDYPYSIGSDELWDDSIEVNEVCFVDEESRDLLEKLRDIIAQDSTGPVSPEYWAAAWHVFDSCDDEVRSTKAEVLFLGGHDPEIGEGFLDELIPSAVESEDYLISDLSDTIHLTNAIRAWNQFVKRMASGGYAEQINAEAEWRRENEDDNESENEEEEGEYYE